MGTIYLFLAEGFEEVEALAPVDVCRRAGLNVCMVSVTDDTKVCSSRNVTIIADALFDDVDFSDADMFVLPGGMPGAKNLMEHQGLRKEILRMANDEKYLAAICAAPMVFGQMDLLKGKNVTCCPGYEDYLKGAHYHPTLVEKDGNIITGCGPSAAFEFGFTIVELFFGNARARMLRSAMGFRS